MACPEVAGVDPRLVLYDRRHADVYAEWLELLGDADAAEDAAQWALLSAAEGVEDDEVSRLVHAALPDLPVAARTALLLREREGLTYAEVAERIGVTQPTAERVVYVARMRLVEALRRIRQALNLAPLLGWLKSTAAGLTAAKGVAAVATLGAAAGLSAIAVPAHESGPEPARQPARPAVTPVAQIDRPAPAREERESRESPERPAAALEERAAPRAVVAPTPSAPAPSEATPTEAAAPAPPAPEPAASEPVQEPAVEPVLPTDEVPLEPIAVEPPVPLDEADPVTVPDVALPPLPPLPPAPLPLPLP
jgi:hypothetical protein